MKIITNTAAKPVRGQGKTLVWGIHPFPGQKILVAKDDQGLCWLGINCGFSALEKNWPAATFLRDDKATAKLARDITKCWPHKLDTLSVPLVLTGTPFQISVWKQLLKIKSGTTVTYQDIAKKIGKPDAVRAVGSAVGKNPLSIVVPCHRVVNKTGGRINFAWGPKIKIALLKGEGAMH
ncbi:MAG: methylated-DNA--[protein]-cysteine S-methyltransferase [Alphaproteobacteria bacterium]|nr:methylated-DNA--[protein]-cysteine S-methyltransferase [Alphaproteobacteria bacterium]